MDRRFVLLAPSLALLLLSALGWWLWPPPPLEPRLAWPALVVLGLVSGAALLAAAWLLERTLPSFRRTSRRLERLVRDLRLPPWAALLAALASGVSEELFFRGWLLPTGGLWLQALVFMALHPAGRSGWSYTLFTGAAGLLFGVLTLASGSLWPALVAHVAVNLHGFSLGGEAWRRRALTPAAAGAPRPSSRSVEVGADARDRLAQRGLLADQREADVALAGGTEGEAGRERDAGGAGEPLGEGDRVATRRR